MEPVSIAFGLGAVELAHHVREASLDVEPAILPATDLTKGPLLEPALPKHRVKEVVLVVEHCVAPVCR